MKKNKQSDENHSKFELIFNRLRSQLLDTSGRNRLVNFRHTRRSIRFVGSGLDDPYQVLLEGRPLALKYVPLPSIDTEQLPTAVLHADSLGLSTSYDLQEVGHGSNYLQTLLYPADLERVTRIMHSDNRLEIEESGNHVLFLVTGFLEYRQSELQGASTYTAPLLLLPVLINRGIIDPSTGLFTYTITALDDEEDIRSNICLREKLSNDFGFQLPPFEQGTKPTDYLKIVAKACGSRKGWTVKNHVSLTLLSFKKISLWCDLNFEEDSTLINHPLLSKLFGIVENDSSCHDLGVAEDVSIDDHPLADLPCIYAADSSQQRALIDAMEGKNLVIVGPPGTGKSQTITNLIALTIGRGKTVLFVSDKKAALEVVHKRIEAAGLGEFCLELHSNKTCKKALLRSLESRLSQSWPDIKTLDSDFRNLQKMRRELNDYASLMKQSMENTEEHTLHDLLWMAEKNRQALGNTALLFSNSFWEEAHLWDTEKLNIRRQILIDLSDIWTNLSQAPSNHPLRGFDFKAYSPLAMNQARTSLQTCVNTIEELISVSSEIASDVHIENSTDLDWKLWIDKLSTIQSFAPISACSFKFEIKPLISDIQSEPLEEILDLVSRLKANIAESKKLLYHGTEIDIDRSLTPSIQDDIPISSLSDVAQLISTALTQGCIIDANCSLAKLESFATWMRSEKRRWLRSISWETAHTSLDKLSQLQLDQITSSDKNQLNISFDWIRLESLMNQAERILGRISQLQASLIPLQQILGIPNQTVEPSLLLACIEMSRLAPLGSQFNELLNNSNQNRTNTINAIKDARDLFKQEKELSTYFLMNALPPNNVLEDIIMTLRKDQWWNTFRPSYRKSKKLYSSILSGQAFGNTETDKRSQLLIWCKKRDCIFEALRKQGVDESFFGSRSQDRKELTAWTEWQSSTRERLDKLPGGQVICEWSLLADSCKAADGQSLKELTTLQGDLYTLLLELKPYYEELQSLGSLALQLTQQKITLGSLEECYEKISTCQNMLTSMGLTWSITSTSWHEISSIWRRELSEIEKLLRQFEHFAPSSMTPRQVRFSLEAHQRAKELSVSLTQNRLFCTFGCSLEHLSLENLTSLEKMFLWWRQLKMANFPKELEYKLFLLNPTDCLSIQAKLKQMLSTLDGYKKAINALQKLTDLDNTFSIENDFKFDSALLKEIKSRLCLAEEALDEMNSWSTYNNSKAQASKLGLSSLIDFLESGSLPVNQLNQAFEYIYLNSCIHQFYVQFPKLGHVKGASLAKTRNSFANLDARILELNGKKIAADIAKKLIPMGRKAAKTSDLTELTLLKHEMSKSKRHMAIRRLMTQAGGAIQALKPCFLMSPLSVAQYLPRGNLNFDLVVIDEASQMRVPEAFGAILRSKQMIVVGDPKQLPPTNFFDKAAEEVDCDNEEVGAIEDGVESILDRALQVFTSPKHLRWHYRSQHQDLISFSNFHFYDNRLIILPSCHQTNDAVGLKYHYLPEAVYLNSTNRIEAETLIEALSSELLKNSTRSVGVVTLNQLQRELLSEMFDQKLRENSALRDAVDQLEAKGADVFIKNLENVQGDERDVIFISTVYGKSPGSNSVRMNFGPINGASGWRRLNVLFTRARQRIELFSSMQAEDIRVSDQSPLGARTLRHYLEFANNRNLASLNFNSGEAESPFESAIAELLQRNNYEVHLQLGVQGYWIDIAVHHPEKPGTFLAAIECDGATYHGSRSARDRDRIRQELLESLGWKGKIYRIWSTDWFKTPLKQSDLLLEFLADLRFSEPKDI